MIYLINIKFKQVLKIIIDSGQTPLENIISKGQTYVGFNPSNGYCETYCAYNNVCPPNPSIRMSY